MTNRLRAVLHPGSGRSSRVRRVRPMLFIRFSLGANGYDFWPCSWWRPPLRRICPSYKNVYHTSPDTVALGLVLGNAMSARPALTDWAHYGNSSLVGSVPITCERYLFNNPWHG